MIVGQILGTFYGLLSRFAQAIGQIVGNLYGWVTIIFQVIGGSYKVVISRFIVYGLFYGFLFALIATPLWNSLGIYYLDLGKIWAILVLVYIITQRRGS